MAVPSHGTRLAHQSSKFTYILAAAIGDAAEFTTHKDVSDMHALTLASFLFFTGLVAFITWRITRRDDHTTSILPGRTQPDL